MKLAPLLLSLSLAAPAFANAGTTLRATTQQSRALTLKFDAATLTTAVREAELCVRPAATVTRARLWMPSMGHGSSATRLVATTPGCVRVERINFLMAGDWEIQVTLEDGDRGTFAFDVVRP